MNKQTSQTIELKVSCDPNLARLVRMTAANVAALSRMSVERVEDIRMAAEEAFVYCCSAAGAESLTVSFDARADSVAMEFALAGDASLPSEEEDSTAAYNDLILGAVCDRYEKSQDPVVLTLEIKAEA